eukprot:SM000064S19824  [mRNA]  locus=s64:534673:535413:+ [translate_table: standard]
MPRSGGRPRLLGWPGWGLSGRSSMLSGMAAILASPVVVGPVNGVSPAALLGIAKAKPASVQYEHPRLRRACQTKPALTGKWAGDMAEASPDTLPVSQMAVSKALA